MDAAGFTVCVLCYGEYPQLAKRSIGSIVAAMPHATVPVRLVLAGNAVCDETRTYLRSVVEAGHAAARDLYLSPENIHKYPMMRRIFHDPERLITTPFVMWFDDDSYIDAPRVLGRPWFDLVYEVAQETDLLGSLYTRRVVGGQPEWLQTQPWYNGKPIARGERVRFATGGWWVLRTEIIYRHDWPIPELDHCGGDMMLGELCRQQGYRMTHFNTGVRINADIFGRESRAARRGFSSPLIGETYPVRKP